MPYPPCGVWGTTNLLLAYCYLLHQAHKRRENGHGSYKEKKPDSGAAEMSDTIREVKVVAQ